MKEEGKAYCKLVWTKRFYTFSIYYTTHTLKIMDTTTHYLPVSQEGPGTMNVGLGGSRPGLGQAACSL